MTAQQITDITHERGRLAGMHDRHQGRSYAECGEDESNTTWHAGYAVGWTRVDDLLTQEN